jgi:uncharacterized protein with FMN-binding domain
MPKRGAISAFLTAIAVVLLINFKTPSQQGLAAFSRQTLTGSQSTSGSAVASGSPGPTASLPGATTQPSATAAPATTASKTFTGPAIPYYFGTAQVQVTMVNGKITAVTALQLPNEGRSAWISQQVEPILRSEVLATQSAQIDLISGATYTSQAYAQSLQGALDQAHA